MNVHLHGKSVSGSWVPITVDQDGALAPTPKTTGWKYTAASGGITNTSDVVLSAAAGAGRASYITAIQISNVAAAVDTEVVIKDGSTVIWRDKFRAGEKAAYAFPIPLESSANTALNAACITTSAQVYINAQGFTDYTSAQITASITQGEELFDDAYSLITDDASSTLYIA